MRHVRELLVLGVALLLTGAVAGAASAANHGVAPEKKKEEKPAAEKMAKPGGEMMMRRHVGTVKAVDAAGKSVTVEEKGGAVNVAVTDKTMIKRGKETVKLADVKAGDQVTVMYMQQDGKDVAQSIMIKGQ